MYYMPMVTLRVDDAEKQAWVNRAGGPRDLSRWIREQCNAAAGTDGKSSHTDSPPTAAATGEGKQRKPKATKQVASRGTAPAGNPAPSPTSSRAHWKLHMPAIQCPSREFVNGKCPTCGRLEVPSMEVEQ